MGRRSGSTGNGERRAWLMVATLAALWLGGRVLVFAQDPAAAPPQEPPAAEQPAAPPAAPAAEDDDLLLGGDDLLDRKALDSAQDQGKDEDSLLVDDESLLDDDSLLDESAIPGESDAGAEAAESEAAPAAEEHARLFLEDKYPSANTCATCHPRQYREWSVSQHAYAQLSPLMMTLQNAINLKTSSTNGDFCLRCHSAIGSELEEGLSQSNLDRSPASREGVTCISCHRMSRDYGKAIGRIAVDDGSILAPVKGPTGNEELARVLSLPSEYRVVTSADEPGRKIHREAEKFFALTTPGFCATCHDVFNYAGFRLEEAASEFLHSPAARRGVTCQDCHMGTVQGKASGYAEGPAALVGGVPTRTRKLTNHYFAGPDSPIVHPGIFPHNVRAAEFKTLREWVQFDYEAGWGTDAFEDTVGDDFEFPRAWRSIDDRYDARQILDDQFELLAWARERRLEVMRNGFALGEVEVQRADRRGLRFSIEVANAMDGHGVPTGFDAERLIFLEVTVTDAEGAVVYRSGDRDPNGDVRDLHSVYVEAGELPLDRDLFTLQSKFVARMNRGGEREQVLPINTSISALPFGRPSTQPTLLFGHPADIRKQHGGIPPDGRRTARYRVAGDLLTGKGPYRVVAKLRYQAVPVNLIHAIQKAGWDYGLNAREVADRVIAGGDVIHQVERTIAVDGVRR